MSRAKIRHKARSRSRQEAGEQAASKRWRGTSMIVIATITTIIITTTVIFSIFTGLSNSLPNRSLAQFELRTKREVATLLSGIPQHGNTLGQQTAPITLQVFGDLQCEDVRTFVLWPLPDIIRDWVRTNIVKIEYRSLKTDTLDPHEFLKEQAAALAAGKQNKLWNFIEIFYHEQGREYTRYATNEYLYNIARQTIGLNRYKWEADRGDRQLESRVVTDNNDAVALGFHSTPSFLIGRAGGVGKELVGYQTRELANSYGVKVKLKYPVSFIDTQIVKAAIEKLP